MSAKQATDNVLDGIAGQLGVGKRTKKPKTHHGNNLPCVTPNPKEVRGKTQSLAKPVDEATTGEECSEPTPSASATGSTRATTRSEALLTTDSTPPVINTELAALQSTVTELAGQMAWFVQRITEDEANEEGRDGLETDSSPVDESAAPDACAPDIDSSSGESYPVPSGTPLDEIQRFYGATETVGEDIDTQLADIVDTLMTTRLPEDKLKEKLSLRVRPANCSSLVSTRVNSELWEKLAPATRSRDVRSQRIQSDVIQGMIAVTEATNTLVRGTRTGETIAPGSLAATVKTLVDALALFGHANQEINQRRRDDQKGDLNQEYKSLGKMDKCHPSLLYGDDLANRIKSINDTNRVALCLTAGSSNTQRGGLRGRNPGRHQPYGSGGKPSWMSRFRGSFLDHPDSRDSRRYSHGRSSRGRGRQRSRASGRSSAPRKYAQE